MASEGIETPLGTTAGAVNSWQPGTDIILAVVVQLVGDSSLRS